MRRVSPPDLKQFFTSPLVTFSLVIFLISLGDALMSYLSPVYIEKHVTNSFVMGLVIAFSSIIGFACDALFPKILAGKSYAFFSWATIITTLLFPISFLLFPPIITFFLFGMAIWGIYYEFLHFSEFHFVSRFLPQFQFAKGWGVISAFKSAAYLIGPLLAVLILNHGFPVSFISALLFFAAAGFGFWIFVSFQHHKTSPVVTIPSTKLPFSRVWRVWRTLWPKIWPLYFFLFFISLIDSAFWTIGTVLTEQLRIQNSFGILLLPAYSLPSLFVGWWAQKIAEPSGKKRAAFITAAVSGLALIPMGFIYSVPLLISTVFISSVFLSLSFPEIFAVFEDYVKRLGRHSDEMIGLQSSAINLSYILGPIIAGALADKFGNRMTFTIIGLGMVAVSIITFVIVPRKIRLPEGQIAII